MPFEPNLKLVKTEPNPAEFQPIDYYENLISLKQRDPKAFACLAPSTKIAAGAYLQQKRQASENDNSPKSA